MTTKSFSASLPGLGDVRPQDQIGISMLNAHHPHRDFSPQNRVLQAQQLRVARSLGLHDLAHRLATCRPRYRLDGSIGDDHQPCRVPICAACGGRDDENELFKLLRDEVAVSPCLYRSQVFTLPDLSSQLPLHEIVERLAGDLSSFMPSDLGRAMNRKAIVAFEVSRRTGRVHPHAHVVGERCPAGSWVPGRVEWSRRTGGRVATMNIRDPMRFASYVTKRFKYRPHFGCTDDEIASLLLLVEKGFRFLRRYGAWNGNTKQEPAPSSAG